MHTSFWKAGHPPTLFAAFLYFDLSFMVWYVLGPLGVQIAADLGLTTQQRSLMVATPILAGAILRFVLGILADRTSPKSAGLFGQVVVILALAVAWLHGIHSFEQALLLGLFLGFAGASFAVSLPLATRARPWASPAPAIPGRSSPRCSRLAWRPCSAGTTCSAWR
jgi:NNP family nitrate/nitrite transporter-like MFS transporter